MYNIPYLVTADKNGNVYDHPYLRSSFKTNMFNIVPYELEMIPMPANCSLRFLKGTPYAYDPNQAKIIEFGGGFPVYTELPPGFLRMLMISFVPSDNIQVAYSHFSPVGWMNDTFVVPAIKIEEKIKLKQDIFDQLKALIHGSEHLKFLNNKFMLDYLKASEIVVTHLPDLSHIRPIIELFEKNSINHVLTLKNIFDDTLINKIRSQSTTVNIEVESYNVETGKKIQFLETDAITFIINSFNPDFYQNKNSFDNLIRLFEIAEKNNLYISINLNTLPGFTDLSKEWEKMQEFLTTFKIEHLKLRHMAISPDNFFSEHRIENSEILGLKNMLKYIKKKFKTLKIGYFSRSREDFYLADGLKFK